MELRTISPSELAVLRAWVAHDVAGAVALRSQLTEDTRVFSSCGCGCASIGLEPLGNLSEEVGGNSIFGIEAEVVGLDGTSVGGMVMSIRDGRIHDVDVHSWFGELEFPSLSAVRWHRRK